MTFEEVKNSIETKHLDDALLILQYSDVPFVAYQWVREIARIHNQKIVYLESIDGIERNTVDIFGTSDINEGLRVYRCDEFNSVSDNLRTEKNLVIITNKVSKETQNKFAEFLCCLPALEGWHIKDYVYSVAKGVPEKDLDWLIQVCQSDIYRIENELDKLRLFSETERKYIFDDMKFQGAFRDLSTFNVFNITNAVTSRDYATLKDALKEIKSFDAEPLGVVTLLYQGFKKLILVWLASNPTPENTGLKSNVIYAINKSPRVYTKTQLLDAYQFLNNIDKMLKTGQIDVKWLVDYTLCKVLTM